MVIAVLGVVVLVTGEGGGDGGGGINAKECNSKCGERFQVIL